MNRKLQPLIGRRVLHLLPVIVLATFVVFSLLHLVPGDPAVTLAGDYASPARIAEIRQLYGLDRPFLVQYGVWLVARLPRRSRPFAAFERGCPSAHPASAAAFGADRDLRAHPVRFGRDSPGLAAATRVGSRLDACIGGLVSLGVALPSFWLAMILVGTLSLKLHLFPATGAADLTADSARCAAPRGAAGRGARVQRCGGARAAGAQRHDRGAGLAISCAPCAPRGSARPRSCGGMGCGT